MLGGEGVAFAAHVAEDVDGLALGGHRLALGEGEGAEHPEHLPGVAPAGEADGVGPEDAGRAEAQVLGQGAQVGAGVEEILHGAVVEPVADAVVGGVGGLGGELAEERVRAFDVAGLAGGGELDESLAA